MGLYLIFLVLIFFIPSLKYVSRRIISYSVNRGSINFLSFREAFMLFDFMIFLVYSKTGDLRL